MAFLIDSNVLARIASSPHPDYEQCKEAILGLAASGEEVVTSVQNICEVWSLFTRPTESRGGFGLDDGSAVNRLEIIERMFAILADPPGLYREWRDLVVTHHVRGSKAHDARIAAWMQLHGVASILTYNVDDFARYSNIVAVSPNAFQQ